MKQSFILIVLLGIAISCKKDKSVDPAPAPPPTVNTADNIESKSLDINLTSVGATAQAQYGSGLDTVILPLDTMATDSVTIEKFAHFQFKVTASNYFDQKNVYTPSSSYLRYIHGISIRCRNAGDSIIKERLSGPAAGLFTGGNLIGPGMLAAPIAYVHYKGGHYADVTNTSFPVGEHYLGFKTTREGKTYYGWIKVESFGLNGIKVKEIAINKTANNTILCGQKN